jgi:hypothetical protein
MDLIALDLIVNLAADATVDRVKNDRELDTPAIGLQREQACGGNSHPLHHGPRLVMRNSWVCATAVRIFREPSAAGGRERRASEPCRSDRPVDARAGHRD